jgi:hypothetical protein
MSKTTVTTSFLFAFTITAAVVNLVSQPRTSFAKAEISGAVVEANEFQSFTYRGKHSEWVRKLLTRVGGWKCPTNAADSGVTPKIRAEVCMRDKYVAAAVLYAWAAECYAHNEEDSKAEEAAEQMYKNLKNANDMCSDAPTFGTPTPCDTERIFDCGEL